MCGMSSYTPVVLAEYRYVRVLNLAACEASFLYMQIMTSGIFRSDVAFIPETDANSILEDPNSQSSISMYMFLFNRPSNGSNIIVYGNIVLNEWGYYCFYAAYWEFGSITYWNLADVNQDLKVDIFDIVLCINSYGSIPSDPQWSTYCDIAAPYCSVDIFDIVKICSSYGEEYTP
jgi:hypothetical protein